jgi:hypothetical protein
MIGNLVRSARIAKLITLSLRHSERRCHTVDAMFPRGWLAVSTWKRCLDNANLFGRWCGAFVLSGTIVVLRTHDIIEQGLMCSASFTAESKADGIR